MDKQQYRYSAASHNIPDFSSGATQKKPFRPYCPPVPPQSMPPDFRTPSPQIRSFGVYCPPHTQNMPPGLPPQPNMPPGLPPQQNMPPGLPSQQSMPPGLPPQPNMPPGLPSQQSMPPGLPPQTNMPLSLDFVTVKTLDKNHQLPDGAPGSWPLFPSVPHDISCTKYSSHPLFCLSRPPPGYFPSLSSSSSNPQPELHAGFEGGLVQSQIHQDALENQSTRDGHGIKFYPLGPASHQPGLESDSNIMGYHFSTLPHTLVSIPNISDISANQRKQDEQWIRFFLHRRNKNTSAELFHSPDYKLSILKYKEKMYRTLEMLSELSALCQMLKTNLENKDLYRRAVELRESLEHRLNDLTDPGKVDLINKKLRKIKTKRSWIKRKKTKLQEEKLEKKARAEEKEAAIDKHQMKQIQEIEEKNKERELKLAADSVLSEVRRKQADTKRMVDVLKALEKLRKLRKDAASRKGLFPEKRSDEVFEAHLMRLRTLIKKRMAIYGDEEKALRVMLEGEQEVERKREQEKRLKKEKEKLQQKKREINSMLFGADLPSDHPLQMCQQFFTQAEHSMLVLVSVRRDWDQFLVPVDHPDGSSVPQGWVLPEPPADDVWAAALEK